MKKETELELIITTEDAMQTDERPKTIVTSKEWKSMGVNERRRLLKLFANDHPVILEYNKDSNVATIHPEHLGRGYFPKKRLHGDVMEDKYVTDVIALIESYFGDEAIPPAKYEFVIDDLARINEFSNIEGFVFDDTEWDGQPRVQGFINAVFGLTGKYYEVVSTLMLMSVVIRPLNALYGQPIKQDAMFILTGEQGKGKSSFVKRLVWNKELWTEKAQLLDEKNNDMLLTNKVVGEVPEMSQISGRKVDAIKSFISLEELTYRVPYGRRMVSSVFKNTLFATTNNPRVLNDPTGNRRFILIDVEDEIHFELMTPDYMKQVYAEAKMMWADWGEPVELSMDVVMENLAFNAQDVLEVNSMMNGLRTQHSKSNMVIRVLTALMDNTLTPEEASNAVLDGLFAHIDDTVARFDEHGLAAININDLSKALDTTVVGETDADSREMAEVLDKHAKGFREDAQKVLTSNGYTPVLKLSETPSKESNTAQHYKINGTKLTRRHWWFIRNDLI